MYETAETVLPGALEYRWPFFILVFLYLSAQLSFTSLLPENELGPNSDNHILLLLHKPALRRPDK